MPAACPTSSTRRCWNTWVSSRQSGPIATRKAGGGGVAVRFDPIRPPGSIAPETALCLFRVVQEGVRNAAKHSGASAIQVTLRRANGSILVAIADNGSGFDPAAGRNGGLGLISMAERVRAIGGRFNILSDPSEGTRLEVQLPALPSDPPSIS